MINIAVYNDNEQVISYLKKCIGNSFKAYIQDFCLNTFIDWQQLLKAHSKEAFQVLFLDIDMPDVKDFNVAQFLHDNFSKCYIVFLTSRSSLVYDAHNFHLFDFIRKDFSELFAKRIKSVVRKLMADMKQNESFILENGDRKTVVYYRDILYVKSVYKYLYYYLKTHDKPIKLRGKMVEIEDVMEKYDFVRIHKRFIVNMKYILNIDNSIGEVVLKLDEGRKSISMSEQYEKIANKAYMLYLRKLF